MSAYAHQLPDELVCRDILHPDSDSVRQRAHMYRRILQGAVDDVGDEYRESGLKVMMRRIVVPKEASFVGMVVVSGNVGLGELDMAADGQRPIDEIHMQAMDIANRDLEAWCSSHLFALTPEPSAE